MGPRYCAARHSLRRRGSSHSISTAQTSRPTRYVASATDERSATPLTPAGVSRNPTARAFDEARTRVEAIVCGAGTRLLIERDTLLAGEALRHTQPAVRVS